MERRPDEPRASLTCDDVTCTRRTRAGVCIVCVVVRAHGASAAALSGVSSASGFGLPAGSLALRARPRGPAGGPRTPRVQGISWRVKRRVSRAAAGCVDDYKRLYRTVWALQIPQLLCVIPMSEIVRGVETRDVVSRISDRGTPPMSVSHSLHTQNRYGTASWTMRFGFVAGFGTCDGVQSSHHFTSSDV